MAKSPAWQHPKSRKVANWDGRCTSCGCGYDAKKFGKGKSGVCNKCSKDEWQSKNQLKVRAQRLHGNAQKRAVAMGWPPPDFDSVWIENKILAGVCEATGIEFDLETQTSKSVHAKNPWVPSIDRIDSSKPYLKENVQVVVYMYNVCKAEFGHADVVRFCKSVAASEAEIG